MSGAVRQKMTKDCPQGSSLGPTEMAYERGIGVRWVEGLATLQAYADDQMVIVTEISVKAIEAKWARV